MCDPAKSVQDYSLKVAGPPKEPENPSTASWALALEARSSRFYRSVKADVCKRRCYVNFCDAAGVLTPVSHHISHCPVIVAPIRLHFHLKKRNKYVYI